MDYKKMTNEEIYEYAIEVYLAMDKVQSDPELESILNQLGM